MTNNEFMLFVLSLGCVAAVCILIPPFMSLWVASRTRRRQFEVIGTFTFDPEQLLLKAEFFCQLERFDGNLWYWLQCLWGRNTGIPPMDDKVIDQKAHQAALSLTHWQNCHYPLNDGTVMRWVQEWIAVRELQGESSIYGSYLPDDTLQPVPIDWKIE